MMLQKLKRRFIAVAMAVILGLELILFISINGLNFHQQKKRDSSMLDFLLRYEGVFPIEHNPREDEFFTNPELAFTTRYFTVRVTGDNRIAAVDTEHIAAVSPAEAMLLSKDIILSGQPAGKVSHFLYKMTRDERTGLRLIVFLDVSVSLERVMSLLSSTAAIFAAFALMTFILLLIFSERAVRPFIENEKRQQQFIHDAGHELKTPLAILSADIDVLELSGSQSRWTDSMRRQVTRMKSLIDHFLKMARYEEMPELQPELFSPAEEAREVLAQFMPLLTQKDVTPDITLDDSLLIEADKRAYRDLLFILLENMAKYVPAGGAAQISITADKDFICLLLANSAPDFVPGDEKRIFERFYRGDKSRSRGAEDPGGSGMGLAIADRIVKSHKGSIYATFKEGVLTIRANLKGRRER